MEVKDSEAQGRIPARGVRRKRGAKTRAEVHEADLRRRVSDEQAGYCKVHIHQGGKAYIRRSRVESGGLYPGRPTPLSTGTGGSASNLDRGGGVSRGHSRESEKPEG